MVIIPAIDILGGECVRLLQGDYDEVTFYNQDPVGVAREFEKAGIRRIHIVDLDAARNNSKRNRKVIRKIRKAVDCVLELGGGIRDEGDVEELLDIGIDRLVVGSMLAKQPGKVEGWIRHFGDMFIAGIDALEGRVKIHGWEDDSGISDLDLAKEADRMGMCSIIYTNIARDGMMDGPDIERTKQIADSAGLPVIISGGVSSLADIEEASRRADGKIVGLITGKAVYEGKIDIREAVQQYQTGSDGEMAW